MDKLPLNNQKDNGDIARARAEGYWLLASLVAKPPGGDLLGRLLDLDEQVLDAAVAREVLSLKQAIQPGNPDDLVQRLAPEYTRLLGGLHPGYGPPPPFESVYRNEQPMGDVTLAVMQKFNEVGIGILDESLGPCDHLASELMFMAVLCAKESEAEEGMVMSFRSKQENFLKQHLLGWLPDWCAAIDTATVEPYFKSVASLLLAACRSDGSFLECQAA